MTVRTTADRLHAARRYFERAVAEDRAERVRQGYEFVGLAQAELAGADLAEGDLGARVREQLGDVLGPHPALAAGGAAAIVTPLWDNDAEGLLRSLLARSGYQALLDVGIWPHPPLSEFHLAEVDEDLADAVTGAVLDVPAGIPAAHTWWRG